MKQLFPSLLLWSGIALCALAPTGTFAQPTEDDPGLSDVDAPPADSRPVGEPETPSESGAEEAQAAPPAADQAPPEAQAAPGAEPQVDAAPADDTTTPSSDPEAQAATTLPGPPPPAGLPEDTDSWEPPSDTLDSHQWDWVLMTTGEWLKGTLETYRDGTLTFESDQFDTLQLDLDDVAGLYILRPHVFQLEDREEIPGTGSLRGDELVINGTRLQRDQLMSLIDGTARELDFWSMLVNLSLSVRTGNTQQTTFSDRFFTRREAPSNRFTIDTNGSFGRLDGDVTVQTQTGLAQLDIFVSKRFYVTPALLSGTHDRFQNINLRLAPGSGFGVHLFDLDNLEWDVEAGAGYQYLQYRSVPMGDDNVFHDALARVGTRLTADVGDPLDIEFSWVSTLVVTSLGRTYHHGQLTLALEVTDAVDATITTIYDRVEKPAERDDGTTPKSDDVQINFGIQVDL